jgi:Legume lectin domain/Chitobiase/beta-hexosaminidase C-terminal domain
MKLFCVVRRSSHPKCALAKLIGLARLLSAVTVFAFAAVSAPAQVNVLTYHNDIARTGQNTNETILTPANVNSTTFGKLFSYTIDGYAYTQPLYYANLTMGAGTPQAGTVHNVFFIATENDSVFAFDADSNGGANGSPLWQVSLIDAAHGATSGETTVPTASDLGTNDNYLSTADIVPQVGITGTPVIDPSTNTMYVVAKSTISGTTYFQRLHALDITTGQEKFGGPVALAAQVAGNGNGSSGGVLNFDLKWENNRPGSLLLNGIVYLGFASHGDNGPWHGWILSYNAANLHQISALCLTPNGQGSGVWQGGAGLAADVPDPVNHPYGRMFISTGNGTYDATTPFANGMDYGDDDIRIDLTNGVLTIQDSFTPTNQANLSSSDQDLGAGGAVLLPPQTGAAPNLLAQVGKTGTIYVVNRDNMGGYSTTSDNIVQEFGTIIGGIWGMPAYWNGNVYFWGKDDNLKAFSLANGNLSSGPVSTGPDESGFPAPTPAISSSGTTNGIIWAIQTDNYLSNGNAILRAYDATNVANALYNSTQNSARDTAPISTKFVVPTIANGKVYVTGSGTVSVYGLLAGSQTAATPLFNPAGTSFATTISVTITDTTTGATIYYTTDGTTPTTASTKYTGAITVSSTETITAIATATGFINSQPASQTYTSTTQTAAPTFNPPAGSYAGTQSITLSDTTAASKIYFTLDGSTPAPAAGTTKLYSAPVSVAQTTTIKAIATSTLTNSPVASAAYTIGPAAPTINFPNGFADAQSSMTFNGSTDLDDSRLQLTNGGQNEASSAFYNTPVNIQSFTTTFTMQLSNAVSDGMTFTIQNVGPTALGPDGGGLGYGPDLPTNPDPSPNTPIANSVAVKFDFFSNAGEGNDSTGLYTDGASPTIPAVDITPSGVELNSGSTITAVIAYDGTNLTLTLTDVSNHTFTQTWPINIPQTVGGNTAYVGFTAGTGGTSSSQKVETWSFTSNATTTPTNQDFSLTAQTASVTINSGAQGTSTIMVAPTTSSFTNPVALTCAVAGTGTVPTCSLSPASVTPGTQGATSTLTISVPASAVVVAPSSHEPRQIFDWKITGWNASRLGLACLLASVILALLVAMSFQRKRRWHYAWLAAALLIAVLQTACGGAGGGSTAPPTTPPETSSQTFTVTVTATSTTGSSTKIQHTATVTVTVP